MNVLHVIPSVSLSLGGPSRSAVHLANHLSGLRCVSVFFYTNICTDEKILDFSSSVVHCGTINRKSNPFLDFFFHDVKSIRMTIVENKIDLIHLHGVWHPLGYIVSRVALQCHVPYVVQPRGMLESWSLNHKKLKKKLALRLYQKSSLFNASGFIATSSMEAQSIHSLGISSPVVVIPNGVEPPKIIDFTLNKSSPKIALFLARIHPKKGLVDLLKAWARLRPAGWVLRIVGPDENGHRAEIESLASRLNIVHLVEFVGPVYGDKRAYQYLSAKLFILPTYSENFGLSIVEALSYGLPVLTTTGTPWSALVDNGCGWWVEPGEDSLLEVLPSALSLSDSDFSEISFRAKQLASCFDWKSVAIQTKNFYEEIFRAARH